MRFVTFTKEGTRHKVAVLVSDIIKYEESTVLTRTNIYTECVKIHLIRNSIINVNNKWDDVDKLVDEARQLEEMDK